MKAERATEFWKAPLMPKTPAATPSNKRPPLTIVTPATSKKRTLENPAEFSFNVWCYFLNSFEKLDDFIVFT